MRNSAFVKMKVVQVILNDALVNRPLELLVTTERTQAWMAKLSATFPDVMQRYAGTYRARGHKARERLKARWTRQRHKG